MDIVKILRNAVCSGEITLNGRTVKKKSNPCTGLDRPSGFQEIEVPRFEDMNVVRLSVQRTGRLYPQEIFLVLISVRE